MENQSLLSRITVDSKIMLGKPIIRGFRITVEQILKALASGVPIEDLLQDYPELEMADIQAAIAYAADIVAQERVYSLEVA